MSQLFENLIVEWLGSLTEEIARSLVNRTFDKSDQLNILLQKYNLKNLKNDFKSLYKYTYIHYSLSRKHSGLGELYSLKSVVELFEYFFYNDESLDDFNNKISQALLNNAFRNERLTKLYYSREAINFTEENKIFCEIFFNAVTKVQSPSEVLQNKKIDLVKLKLMEISTLFNKNLDTYRRDLNKFKIEYFRGFKMKVSKVSFLGIELPTVNRPNEVDLMSLFEEPLFKLSKLKKNNFIPFRHSLWKKAEQDLGKSENYPQVPISGIGIKDKPGIISDKIEKKRYPFEEFRIEEIKSLETRKKIEEAIEIEKIIPSSSKNRENEIGLDQIFSNENGVYIVLIGNPGAGKSSLIKYISLNILEGNDSKLKIRDCEKIIPFIISLNDYNRYKKSFSGGITGFIHSLIKSKYQVNLNNSYELLGKILNNEKTIIFFDGLDEIFDINERTDVRDDIQLFALNHINAMVFVTSRYESYQEVSMNPDMFIKLEVKNFSNLKIYNFVTKWFNANGEENEEDKTMFLSSLEAVAGELKSNPLLLTLILLIYKYEKDLPKSKIDIYESCTKTLVERRDEKEKKLKISKKIKNKLSLLSVLAFWQYKVQSNMTDQVISHTNVKRLLTNYLMDKKIIDSLEESEKNVEVFMEFAQLRSIYFENNFTHKTFLEYLTAYYIYANYQVKGNIDGRDNIFIEVISNSYWYIVIELFILKVDKESIDSEILDGLIKTLIRANIKSSVKVLLPIIPNVTNLNINIRKLVIKSSIAECINHVTEDSVLLFEHFKINLNKIEFCQLLIDVIDEMSVTEINHEKLVTFILELQLASGRSIINNNTLHYLEENYYSSPYTWILYNIKKIEKEWRSYFIMMKRFYSHYSELNKFETFTSTYSNTIINNSDKFNWVYSCLFVNIEENVFLENISSLEKLNVSVDSIVKNYKKDKLKDKLSAKVKLKLLENNSVRNLILKSIPVEFRIDSPKM